MKKSRLLGAVCTCFLFLIAPFTPLHADLIQFTEVSRIDRPFPGGWSIGALGDRLFSNDGQFISEIDPNTGAVINRRSLNTNRGIFGLAGNLADGFLYADSNFLHKVDPDTLTIVETLGYDSTNFQGLGASNGLLYASENTYEVIYEIDPATGGVLRTHDITDVYNSAFGGTGGDVISGIEVFDGNIFVNIMNNSVNRSQGTELHQFRLNDFSHVGVSYVGDHSMGSAYDGEFLWLTGSDESELVKLAIIPIPPALWLFGSGLIGLIGVARRRS